LAVAVDGTTPARFTGALITNGGAGAASASFTPPLDALLVVCIQVDTDNAASNQVMAVAASAGVSGGFTARVERNDDETTAGGYSAIFTGRVTTSTAMTVTVSRSSGNSGSGRRVSAVCYVMTGVDVAGTPVDSVAASNEGGSNTNNLTTTSVTPGATGMLVVSDCEWNALGAFEASSDLTQNADHYASAISVCSGYKTCTSGVGVTANLNASGSAGAQHKWCQIVVRQAAATFMAAKNRPILQAVNRASYW
jgi:hypothetical protein